jgi:preprotein translocase subunit SecG
MTILINLLLVIEGLVAVLMMFVILMQRPKSEGLGAAFGGGVTENIFGAQTTNVLTTITTWLASIFFVLVLTLSALYAHRGAPDSALRRELMKNSAPAKPAAAPLSPKAAAKNAAADAKAKVAPVAAPPVTGAASSPADAAVGAIPAAAGTNPTAAPNTTAAPAATAKPTP